MLGCLSISKESQTALGAGFGNTRTSSEKRRQIRIDGGRAVDPRHVSRRLKTRENRVGNLASRNAFLAVARWNIARPVPDVFHAEPILRSEKNHRMSVLFFAHLPGPKYFHEIARFRLLEFIEISAQPKFVKKTGGARSVRIPPAPNPFAVALISNDQLFQCGVIETQLAARTQGLDGSHENEIGRA